MVIFNAIDDTSYRANLSNEARKNLLHRVDGYIDGDGEHGVNYPSVFAAGNEGRGLRLYPHMASYDQHEDNRDVSKITFGYFFVRGNQSAWRDVIDGYELTHSNDKDVIFRATFLDSVLWKGSMDVYNTPWHKMSEGHHAQLIHALGIQARQELDMGVAIRNAHQYLSIPAGLRLEDDLAYLNSIYLLSERREKGIGIAPVMRALIREIDAHDLRVHIEGRMNQGKERF